jgi:hypothetical protein
MLKGNASYLPVISMTSSFCTVRAMSYALGGKH